MPNSVKGFGVPRDNSKSLRLSNLRACRNRPVSRPRRPTRARLAHPQILLRSLQNYIDATFYTDSDVVYSFVSASGQQIDCINFNAQHTVKALLAQGIAIPPAPTSPASLASMPAPNVPPNVGFFGQPDINGHAQQCPSGTVPTMRPTMAQVQAAGGVNAYRSARAAAIVRLQTPPYCAPVTLPPPPVGPVNGCQHSVEHDCWLNSAPGDAVSASAFFSQAEAEWEHAAGIQNNGFSPPGAAGFFGMEIVTSVQPAFVPDPQGHSDSQLWAQTGTCENWYGSGLTQQCLTGSQCGPGSTNPNCAVQSLEVAALAGASGVPNLYLYFTPDGYFTSCAAGLGCNGLTPTCPSAKIPIPPPGTPAGTPGTATDCFVPWTQAAMVPNLPLLNQPLPQVGQRPFEAHFKIWNGANTSSPGWWIYVNGSLIGWYPPSVFNWSDGTPGPMSSGPATYLQVGGEVQDSFPNGVHADTTMVSPNSASAGFGFAAHNRNVGYWDAMGTRHDANLQFVSAPSFEGDNASPGVCGFASGGWADSSGTPGAYSVTNQMPPGDLGWGTYLYFGGGKLTNEVTAPSAVITLSNVSFATTGFNLLNCGAPAQPATPQTINGLNANGQVVITCTPNGISKTAKAVQEEVSCGDGHGALVVASCTATGAPGNVALNGSVALSLETSCGSGVADPSSERTFTITNLATGVPQGTSALQACDLFENVCSTGMDCLFNAFTADVSVSRNGN